MFQTAWCRRIQTGAAWTEFLVDADTHSVEEIGTALQMLQSEGKPLKTTFFAEPRRQTNKKWARYMKEQQVRFQAVSPLGGNEDPVDKAIKSCMHTLATVSHVDRIVLLTSDADFLADARSIGNRGKSVAILVPQRKRSTVWRYRSGGVETLEVPGTDVEVTTQVQALLHEDGSGYIQPCAPIPHCPVDKAEKETEDVRQVLTEGGLIKGDACKLIPCVAKCWFSNTFGTLSIFPTHCAISQLHAKLPLLRPLWHTEAMNLAFFFPLRGGGAPSARQRQKFGGVTAWKVAQSTGPFMLRSSSNLSMKALQQLGYIDAASNTDIREAMLVFANMSSNKKTLREVWEGCMPNTGSTSLELDSAFQTAFLSNLSSGFWQPPPDDSLARAALVKAGCLNATSEPPRKVLAAMQDYCKRRALPPMKTYNGYVWRILCHLNDDDPKRRDMLEF